MHRRTAHRSYVSYIDKSREFYRAHGYENPYAWAHFDDVPFAKLSRPINETRFGIVTTADQAPRGAPRDKRLFVAHNDSYDTLYTEKSWDKEATHTNDPDTYLPVARLQSMVSAGTIGSMSSRFYGVPTNYSQRATLTEDAPQVESWMREDGVEAALLVAL